jgi:ElaB/YqjD/DUF883 family membrane-anchored ribosome-binding protein
MPILDETKDIERKIGKENAKFDSRGHEASAIRENVTDIARSVKTISNDGAREITEYLREIVAEIKDGSVEAMRKTEGRIRSKPGQSIAIAFGAGILASILFGRR